MFDLAPGSAAPTLFRGRGGVLKTESAKTGARRSAKKKWDRCTGSHEKTAVQFLWSQQLRDLRGKITAIGTRISGSAGGKWRGGLLLFLAPCHRFFRLRDLVFAEWIAFDSKWDVRAQDSAIGQRGSLAAERFAASLCPNS
jgi:hypothetical protein